MVVKAGQTVRCPHCDSEDVLSSLSGVSVDTMPPIYYVEWACQSCKQYFTVKSDAERGVRAILKDYVIGHYYPDDESP
jgi:transposase-like protein